VHLKPIAFKEACAFIEAHHRHHQKPQGHKFSIAAIEGEAIVGVAIVGRPISRMLDNGYTAEVTRLCTDGTYNACSMLYAAAARGAKAMGYVKIITYILDEETGRSLKASSWFEERTTGGGSWSRDDKHPLGAKRRYARVLNAWPPSLDVFA